MADTVNAADRCCANVERAEREIVQPRPCASYGRHSSPPASPHLLSSRCFLPSFLPSFLRRVGCSTPNTPRLLHICHFCLLACALRAFLLSSPRVLRFPRRRCTNFAAAGTVAAKGRALPTVGLTGLTRGSVWLV